MRDDWRVNDLTANYDYAERDRMSSTVRNLEDSLKKIVIKVSDHIKPIPEITIKQKTLDEIIDECRQPKPVEKCCPECYGGGIQIVGRAFGPMEVKCERCDGVGTIEVNE